MSRQEAVRLGEARVQCVSQRALDPARPVTGPRRDAAEQAANPVESPPTGPRSRRRWKVWLRPVVGAAILAGVAWRLGAGPFLDGVRAISPGPLGAAMVIGALTTLCCAWRWRLVGRGLGVPVSMGAAVASYYRSQFLNSTLPGGVLGDVHRGVQHGHEVGNVGRGLRAVAWERTAGQMVQAVLAVILVAALPSPVRPALPYALIMFASAALALVMLMRSARGPSRWARTLRAARGDIRHAVLARGAWPGVAVASTVVVAGHLTTFLIAAHIAGSAGSAGSAASVARMTPLAVVTLVAMGLPTNLGGWGPREGVAGALFGAAGLGSAHGVATAVAYGVMALAACLPGAIVLILAWARATRSDVTRSDVAISDVTRSDLTCSGATRRTAHG